MPIKQAEELKPGMILDQDVLNQFQIAVLSEGTVLTEEHIRTLNRMDLDFIFVRDEPEKISQESVPVKNETVKKKEEKKKTAFEMAVAQTRAIANQIEIGQTISREDAFRRIKELVKTFYPYDNLLEVVGKLDKGKEYEFAHGTSVAVISIFLGKWLDLDHQKIYLLALGAYLSDIGMFKIPKEILNKTGDLTDEERKTVQEHVNLGVEILRTSGQFSKEVIETVAEHHERLDGSGYPKGIVGTEINEFARIVSVADTFHALLSKRPYRDDYSVFEATEMLWEMSYSSLDAKVTERLVKFVTAFWVNRRVVLSNGLVGEVVMSNRYDRFRPLIKTEGAFIDLSLERSCRIVDISENV